MPPSPSLLLFHGTFIHLPLHPVEPATPSSPPKHVLEIRQGALWVKAADGRIEGCDWGVKDEEGLRGLIESNGWKMVEEEEEEEGREIVKVVRGREGRNGFFFPGFIGIFPLLRCIDSPSILTLKQTHTSTPRNTPTAAFSVPPPSSTGSKPTLSPRILLPQQRSLFAQRSAAHRTQRLQPRRPPHARPRHDLRQLFCYNPRPRHEPARRYLPCPRPARVHRTRMHGQSRHMSGRLYRRLRRSLHRRNPRVNRAHIHSRPLTRAHKTHNNTALRGLLHGSLAARTRQARSLNKPTNTHPNTHQRKYL